MHVRMARHAIPTCRRPDIRKPFRLNLQSLIFRNGDRRRWDGDVGMEDKGYSSVTPAPARNPPPNIRSFPVYCRPIASKYESSRGTQFRLLISSSYWAYRSCHFLLVGDLERSSSRASLCYYSEASVLQSSTSAPRPNCFSKTLPIRTKDPFVRDGAVGSSTESEEKLYS
ncbi:hypothetical protein BDN72DRAFT_676630 [Pluteus cervinus]|uniref:Uncharacterized protein n=1 Tax=Pluteus cervinus TaxID=181527 RepID=A0ACD3AT58_9AGAR|nr:hypothetical protein BDN72DRAFT_676630 [Pluteus cervinus]